LQKIMEGGQYTSLLSVTPERRLLPFAHRSVECMKASFRPLVAPPAQPSARRTGIGIVASTGDIDGDVGERCPEAHRHAAHFNLT
jgi:hypothetical protein